MLVHLNAQFVDGISQRKQSDIGLESKNKFGAEFQRVYFSNLECPAM
jgi:hypothetical protein